MGRGRGIGRGRGRGQRRSQMPTLEELLEDKISQVAAQYWAPFTEDHKPFDPSVIESMYNEELLGTNFAIRRVMLLEFSQYLENYLWPNFEAGTSTTPHAISIAVMVNEKFRERVPVWDAFESCTDQFPGLFNIIANLMLDSSLSIKEHTILLMFLDRCFSSVEVEFVRDQIQKFVALTSWVSLPPFLREQKLAAQPKLKKYWSALQKQDAKRSSGELQLLQFERTFLFQLMKRFLQVLSTVPPEGPVEKAVVNYCERFLEFLLDLIALLPTRRFFNALLESAHVVVLSRLSGLAKRHQTEGHLFTQLLERLAFYCRFEINDLTGEPQTEHAMMKLHYEEIKDLQKSIFLANFSPDLRDFCLTNVASVDTHAALKKNFALLEDAQLQQIAYRLGVIEQAPGKTEEGELEADGAMDRSILTDLLVYKFERRPSQLDALNEMPLYPTEEILWDENIVPSEFFSGDSCLALDKLNLQFLTLHDYLLRNFNLFRLEATYEIRQDVEDVVFRMRPYKHESLNKTVFGGWARMAMPINNFTIIEVSKPNIGERSPSAVRADVTISLGNRVDVRKEWEGLRKHDVCFLLSVRPRQYFGHRYDHQAPLLDQIEIGAVRGCEIEGMLDDSGRVIEEWQSGQVHVKGDDRTWRVWLDTNQYRMDLEKSVDFDYEDVYGTFNVIMRRKPKENNFKAVLETIRQLMNTSCVVPQWLQDIILGYGDPAAAHYSKMDIAVDSLDFCDTFLNFEHLKASFSGSYNVHASTEKPSELVPPFRVEFKEAGVDDSRMDDGQSRSGLHVTPYMPAIRGPYPSSKPKRNAIMFTPVQVEAIRSGMQPGLTMIVGPPGTGKTDVAVQIISNIYHNWPEQRTLIVTHSNQALNQIFEKIMALDIDERHLLRLGHGEEALETEKDFSRYGRVNYVLAQRLKLLGEVERLQQSLGVHGDISYTCETAGHFYLYQVLARWEKFTSLLENTTDKTAELIESIFPFNQFFSNAPQPVFKKKCFESDLEIAQGCWRYLRDIFQQLEEFRAFELLRSGRERTEYLLVKEAKIIAMTCTHAALRRRDLVQLGFKFDNILMEESAQILEIETFIPLLLQNPQDGHNRLKRWIMIGDHHQLPPVIKNNAFQKYSNMEQSLFARLVRLGVPPVELDAQGRARPSIATLYNWRYKALGDLPHVHRLQQFVRGNAGFLYEYQLVDVRDFNGVGESTPSPYFYQNLAEAEYAVAIYMYMRLCGYKSEQISILTTYNGQKHLIRDVVRQRCASNPLIGEPHKIATVDKYQGQQNDFIILSLVRSKAVGHLRDVRRLIVAMSRARLGLYVLGRVQLFRNCFELTPAFNMLCERPQQLMLLPHENHPTQRKVGDPLRPGIEPVEIADMPHMAQFVYDLYALKVEKLTTEFEKAREDNRLEEEARKAPYKEGGEVEKVREVVVEKETRVEKDIEFEIFEEG